MIRGREVSAAIVGASLLVASRALAAKDDGSPHSLAATSTAPAPEPPTFSFRRPHGEVRASKLEVVGYLLPQFEILSLPSALPREKLQYGARGTRAGFAFYGSPWTNFTYFAHFVVAPAGVEGLTLLSPTTSPSIGITLPTSTQTSIDVEEATVGYRATSWFTVKTGLMRVPFSLGQTTPIPKQMFPFRPPVTTEFQSGADAAATGSFSLLDGRLQLHAGVMLGASLGAANPNQTVRGPAIVASVAAHPLGAMTSNEGDESRGPLRFAVGVASIYRHASAFDPTGYEATTFDDVRFTGWAKLAFRGAYIQGEYLRRLRTDDLSGRPSKADGGYGEAAYFQPIGDVAIGPIVRAGVLEARVDFAPRKFTSFEAGVAFFPHGHADEPERLRILVEYFGARLTPPTELQHEVVAQLQLEF